jgi:dTMP kinase
VVRSAARSAAKSVGRGRLITLEGGEGAGKSTQIKLLALKLQASGKAVITTREPGGAPGAEAIRALLVQQRDQPWSPLTDAFLHSAARAEHVAATVRPAIEAGKWVISDRFSDSTVAYQGYGLGLSKKLLSSLIGLSTGGLKPDLTLILDLPVEQGLARAGKRIEATKGPAEDRYERMGLAFHQRLRRGFRTIAKAEPRRCKLIDASGSPEEVAAQIWALVAKRFKL